MLQIKQIHKCIQVKLLVLKHIVNRCDVHRQCEYDHALIPNKTEEH